MEGEPGRDSAGLLHPEEVTFIPTSLQSDVFHPTFCWDACLNAQSRTKPQKERSGLASAVGAALPMPSPLPPPPPPQSLMLWKRRGGKFCPLWPPLTFSCGCVLCGRLCHEERRSLYPLLSLNTVRHVPVVTGLSQENLSYWIWKLLQQSGRLGCLISMWRLRLLSWWRAGPQGDHLHGSLTWQIWRPQSRASSSQTEGIKKEHVC